MDVLDFRSRAAECGQQVCWGTAAALTAGGGGWSAHLPRAAEVTADVSVIRGLMARAFCRSCGPQLVQINEGDHLMLTVGGRASLCSFLWGSSRTLRCHNGVEGTVCWKSDVQLKSASRFFI